MPQVSHREQLLQAAIECLQTKGYARTTARDIAAAADANLASIGYHFGSKEALLYEAIIHSTEAWTRRIGELTFSEADLSPLARMAMSWQVMLDSFAEQKPLLLAFVESLAQAGHSDELRAQMADHYQRIRDTVGEMVRASLGRDAESHGADPNVIGSFLIAVCDGLLVQWLLDPERTPSGEELVSSLAAGLSLAGEASEDGEELTGAAP